MCLVWFCCFVFLTAQLPALGGRYHPRDSNKDKIMNTASTLVLGLFMTLVLPTLFSFPQSDIFLLRKNQICLIFLHFLLNGCCNGIIQLSYSFASVWLFTTLQKTWTQAVTQGCSGCPCNLFTQDSIYLLVFWFISGFWGMTADMVVRFFTLHCIVFRWGELFSPLLLLFLFLFFSLKGFLWEKFSGLPSRQCHNSQLYCLIQVLQAAGEVEPNEIKGFFIKASTRMCWYG